MKTRQQNTVNLKQSAFTSGHGKQSGFFVVMPAAFIVTGLFLTGVGIDYQMHKERTNYSIEQTDLQKQDAGKTRVVPASFTRADDNSGFFIDTGE